MITINRDKLREVLSGYKRYFHTKFEYEIYKWKAIKRFQDNWNLEAVDFKGMFEKATALHANLLTSRNHFPRGVILDFCNANPNATRNMFQNLFNESLPLADRINKFIAESKRLQEQYLPGKAHYQDLNAISVYLWSMFPDKYYIYKYSELKATSDVLESSYFFKRGGGVDSYLMAIELFDTIRSEIQLDPEIRTMLNLALTDDCYKDPSLNSVVVDIHYYVSRYFTSEDKQVVSNQRNVQYWMYAPGERAKYWEEYYHDGIMGIGWSEMGDLTQYKDNEYARKKLTEYYGVSSNHSQAACMLSNFAFDIKPGDIVFVKCGRNKIVGRGIVTSDYIYDKDKGDHPNIRKVNWTNKGEWITNSRQATKTITNITTFADYVDKLNKLIDGVNPHEHSSAEPGLDYGQRYWWLVANPKIWSMADMKIGEEQSYSLYSQNGNKRKIFQNFLDAKAGDVVVGYEATPTKQIVGLLEISHENDGEELYFKKTESFPNPIDYSLIKNTQGLEDMEFMKNQQGSFYKLSSNEYEIIMDLVRDENPLPKEEKNQAYDRSKFLDEVFVSYNDYNQLENLLLRKQNLILQGAPGVGKTFAAKRLAYSIMGEKDEKRIMQVQFHQNYSYEDFVMGYKPNEEGGFELKPGIFYRFCKQAAVDREHMYFFIIDEINRGNLSKIFGELLMLIENDYRDKPIQLSYRDEKFAVPDNLYLIGMMNTADRSLAMIDYALRRRFSFFEMKPGFDNPAFKEYVDKMKDPQLNNLVKAIIELNKVIEGDDSLGSGFCIGHSYLCNLGTHYNLENIVEYDIIQMLREYWFDNNDRFNQEAQKLRSALK